MIYRNTKSVQEEHFTSKLAKQKLSINVPHQVNDENDLFSTNDEDGTLQTEQTTNSGGMSNGYVLPPVITAPCTTPQAVPVEFEIPSK